MKHIILIGYKSVGKSAIGQELAKRAHMEFIDLDEIVESIYKKDQGVSRNCRQIMTAIGQNSFRELEHTALESVLRKTTAVVISLGGGTPLLLQNKMLIKDHTVVQITAPRNIVFERIMINGKPAFFSDTEHPFTAFKKTWEDRAVVYDALTRIKVDNSGSLEEAVHDIKEKMKQNV